MLAGIPSEVKPIESVWAGLEAEPVLVWVAVLAAE